MNETAAAQFLQNSPAAPLPAEQMFAGSGELARLIGAFDWTNTPIGPPPTWPQSLKTAVGIMLTSRQPIWIGWGPDLTYLYNDAYKSIIESFVHAGAANNVRVELEWIDSEDLHTESDVKATIGGLHGLLVAPGFGSRGVASRACSSKVSSTVSRAPL